MSEEKRDVIRETDAEGIALARKLMREARYGALAVIDAGTGWPAASRVAVATDCDGTPVILISALSGHTPALLADPRCSLLLGEPGKGDPLAHPRISISCLAVRLERGSDEQKRVEARYLRRQPKAKLYAQFADFSWFRLEPQAASLNGGFARAYRLTPDDLLVRSPALAALAEREDGAVEHMNADHADAIALYAEQAGAARDAAWVITGLDPEGMDLASGDRALRIPFPEPLPDAAALRTTLVDMARSAREKIGKNTPNQGTKETSDS